jgi:hypothetical protein
MKTKLLILTTLITLTGSYVLGVLRFEYVWASNTFKIILFPFGYLYSLIELQIINEYLQLFVFLAFAIFQSILFYRVVLLILNIKKMKRINP